MQYSATSDAGSEISELENIIEGCMEKKRDKEGEFIKHYQAEIFKSVVEALNAQISILIDNISYLKEESSNKNNMINHLMGIITTFQINQPDEQSTINSSYINSTYSNKESEINKNTSQNTVISDIFTSHNTSISETYNQSFEDASVHSTPDNDRINIDRGFNDILCSRYNNNLMENNKQRPNETTYNEYTANDVMTNSVRFNSDIYHTKDFHAHKSKEYRNNNINSWNNGTVLIASDSMLNKIDERRLSKHMNVKVRCFPGSTIQDMYNYLAPLLRKQPSYLILHVSTNNCTIKQLDVIVNELLHLKRFIEMQLPSCTVVLSEPTIRTDNIAAANCVKEVCKMLRSVNVYLLENSNVEAKHLGRGGLHLNEYGTKRMALNLITFLRNL